MLLKIFNLIFVNVSLSFVGTINYVYIYILII